MFKVRLKAVENTSTLNFSWMLSTTWNFS